MVRLRKFRRRALFFLCHLLFLFGAFSNYAWMRLVKGWSLSIDVFHTNCNTDNRHINLA
jgi:hypothetical protein